MSRHQIALPNNRTLAVGYDNPMRTFFAQVFVNQNEKDLRDEPLKFWLGCNFDEFPELTDFLINLALRGYSLPSEIVDQLQRDWEAKFFNIFI